MNFSGFPRNYWKGFIVILIGYTIVQLLFFHPLFTIPSLGFARTGFANRCYANVTDWTNQKSYIDMPITRYAEVLLIYAEATFELTGSISVYRFTKGVASFIQTVYTHPSNFKGASGSADIHLSPDGLFLYASNRGDENNISDID